MEEFTEIPEAYRKVIRQYAEANHQTAATAFSNLMDFLQVKDEACLKVSVAVENPKQYLTDAEELNAAAVLQLYMDIFGEDTVGATVHGYYNPDRLNVVLLDIQYDTEFSLWDLLELFHYQLPCMDIKGDRMDLQYIQDAYGEMPARIEGLFKWFRDPDREDDGFGKAGYYESIYDDPDEDPDGMDSD